MSAPLTTRQRDHAAVYRAGLLVPFPDPPDEGLFSRVARDARLRPPAVPLLGRDAKQQAEADAWIYRVWAAYPAWGYCSTYLGEHARPVLPRVLAEIGLGRLVGFVSDDPDDADLFGIATPAPDMARAWGWEWVVAHAPKPHLVPLVPRRPDCPAPGLCLLLHRDAAAPLVFLCEASHRWWCPALARKGACLVDLAAWRWEVTPARAAKRLARLLGLPRAVP